MPGRSDGLLPCYLQYVLHEVGILTQLSQLFPVTTLHCRDYIHAVLLWTELQPPYTVLIIFVALYTLVSLPLVWGYIVVNLACGYLYGLVYGMAVTVVTATVGIALAHVLCKVK